MSFTPGLSCSVSGWAATIAGSSYRSSQHSTLGTNESHFRELLGALPSSWLHFKVISPPFPVLLVIFLLSSHPLSCQESKYYDIKIIVSVTLKKKRRVCITSPSKRIIYKLGAAISPRPALRECYFSLRSIRIIVRWERNSFNHVLFLTAWLRLILYNIFLFCFVIQHLRNTPLWKHA